LQFCIFTKVLKVGDASIIAKVLHFPVKHLVSKSGNNTQLNMNSTNNKITIDIVSDVACPWCFVGKKRLEEALSQLPDATTEIRWHPFQLDPTIPTEGVDRETYFNKKFGSGERVEEIYKHMDIVGKSVGIDFRFDKMKKAVNTLPFHNLLFVGREDGNQDELKEHLFKAYFEQGVDFSQRQSYIDVMLAFGWPIEKTEETLDNKEIDYWVAKEIKHYQEQGVTGVPFFIFNNKYGFSGAQPPEVFVETITKIQAEMQPAAATGEACDVETGEC
jgi:predicted DsbA family dithiol-disulfide isomerase